jgi:predicted nucleotidyltransferase
LPESKPTIGRYLDLEAKLVELLGRRVDLVDDKSFENPYFQQSVRLSRVTIFPL